LSVLKHECRIKSDTHKFNLKLCTIQIIRLKIHIFFSICVFAKNDIQVITHGITNWGTPKYDNILLSDQYYSL